MGPLKSETLNPKPLLWPLPYHRRKAGTSQSSSKSLEQKPEKLLGPSRKENLRVHGGLLGGSWDLVSQVISRLQLG